MAKQVVPTTPPKWYAAFAYPMDSAGGNTEYIWIKLSLGKLKLTAGRTTTIPPPTGGAVIADWNRGYRIVEALRPCVRAPNGYLYNANDAFLEIRDTRMVRTS